MAMLVHAEADEGGVDLEARAALTSTLLAAGQISAGQKAEVQSLDQLTTVLRKVRALLSAWLRPRSAGTGRRWRAR